MGAVKAKFVCNRIELNAYRGQDGTKYPQPPVVHLAPVTGAEGEDKAFWDATPSGEMKMTITNPSAAEFFQAGDAYYLTFEPAS